MMFKRTVQSLVVLLTVFSVPMSLAIDTAMYTYKNAYFSVSLPQSMTLRNEFTTPKKVTDVKESVFVLANYGAQDHKQAVSGHLDPQVRAIIGIRKGKFSPETGAAVQITLFVDSIKQRRGLPVDAEERMATYHAVQSTTINGHPFKTYQLTIKNSPVIYRFYSGIIKDRLVSFIWTAYSKHPNELRYYTQLANQAVTSFRLYGYQ